MTLKIIFNMPKKLLFIFAAIFVLSGCVTNPLVQYVDDVKYYTAQNRPKALGGSIQWSTYYEGALAIAQQIPVNTPGRSSQISDWTEALSMAKEYEAGRITKEQFFKWREDGNSRAASQKTSYEKNRAQCEYEAKSGSAGVRDTGRSGLNFDQMFKEKELFELCMRARQ